MAWPAATGEPGEDFGSWLRRGRKRRRRKG